jgi:hypothetical protein
MTILKRFSALAAAALLLTLVPFSRVRGAGDLSVSAETISAWYGGGEFPLRVTVVNNTDQAVNGILVDISSSPLVEVRSAAQYIETLPAGKSTVVEFTVSVSDESYRGAATLLMDVRIGGTVVKSDIPVNVYVETPSAPETKLVLEYATFEREAYNVADTAVMSLSLYNSGGAAINNVLVEVAPPAGVNSLSASKITVPTLGRGARVTLEFRYSVQQSAAGKYQDFDVRATYSEEYNGEKLHRELHKNGGFLANSAAGAGAANVVISGVSLSKASVVPNENVQIDVTIENRGTAPTGGVTVTFTPESGLINRTQNVVMIDSISAGGKKTVSCTVFASDEAVTKNYTVGISAAFEYGAGDELITQTLSQYTGVFVSGKEPGDDGKNPTVPKIIISKYSIEPNRVPAGTEFILRTTFMNTSSAKNVRNIKVSFSGTETTSTNNNVFTPVNASNVFFIDSIGKKATAEREVTLYIVPDAQQKTYILTFSIEYEDDQGNPYTETSLVGIPVTQPVKLGTGEVIFPTDAFLGQPFYVGFDFYNTGKESIYNCTFTTEGDVTSMNGSYYAGKLDPGASDYYENQITPNNPGLCEGKLVISFEDSSGTVHTVEKPFSINVMEMEYPTEPEWPGEPLPTPSEKSGPAWYWYALGGAVILAAALIVLKTLRNKKRQKQILEEDEGYDSPRDDMN